MPKTLRPADDEYYEDRTDYVRQGDLFRDVDHGYPIPEDAAFHHHGDRRFLSGPFSACFGILLTPTCSMTAQGEEPGRYAHPIRLVAPLVPLEKAVEQGVVKSAAVESIRALDNQRNYLLLPAIADAGMPESLALLYAPIALRHDLIGDRRIAQLSPLAARWLKRKLAAHVGGSLFSLDEFSDP